MSAETRRWWRMILVPAVVAAVAIAGWLASREDPASEGTAALTPSPTTMGTSPSSEARTTTTTEPAELVASATGDGFVVETSFGSVTVEQVLIADDREWSMSGPVVVTEDGRYLTLSLDGELPTLIASTDLLEWSVVDGPVGSFSIIGLVDTQPVLANGVDFEREERIRQVYRLDSDGWQELDFVPGLGAGSTVRAGAVLENGDLLFHTLDFAGSSVPFADLGVACPVLRGSRVSELGEVMLVVDACVTGEAVGELGLVDGPSTDTAVLRDLGGRAVWTASTEANWADEFRQLLELVRDGESEVSLPSILNWVQLGLWRLDGDDLVAVDVGDSLPTQFLALDDVPDVVGYRGRAFALVKRTWFTPESVQAYENRALRDASLYVTTDGTTWRPAGVQASGDGVGPSRLVANEEELIVQFGEVIYRSEDGDEWAVSEVERYVPFSPLGPGWISVSRDGSELVLGLADDAVEWEYLTVGDELSPGGCRFVESNRIPVGPELWLASAGEEEGTRCIWRISFGVTE